MGYTKKMELIINMDNMKKNELLDKCKELGITKCNSKNKTQLIEIINNHTNLIHPIPIFNDLILDAENIIVSSTITSSTSSTITMKSLTKHLKPLVKWSGGKGDEIKQFEKYLPTEYNIYIEPFIGGGALYFYLSPHKAVISDVHLELIDLYKSIGERKSKEIYDFMTISPNDEETYYKIRDKMVINDALDNAKRFYYQRKTCFRGMLRYNKGGKFNIPFGKYKTINYNDLQNKDYEELLSRTEILNNGFETIFENYNDENNFMFLDPPYDSEFTDYGYCKFGKEEQKKLAELFKETKNKCLMVIGKTAFIEELYKGYIVDEYEKKYKFKLYAGRVGDEINTKHLIIKNY